MASKHQTALFEDNLKKLVLWHMWLWKKPFVNSIPPQEKVTIRNGTCRLDLGWLVSCALEWWVKIHSLSKWWSGVCEEKSTWSIQKQLCCTHSEIWWRRRDCVGCNVIHKNWVSPSTERQPQQGWLFWYSQELCHSLSISSGIWRSLYFPRWWYQMPQS